MQIQPNITRSAKFGNLRFPTREDYVKYFIDNNIVKNETEIWNNESYISIIHRHWHGEGRNGCIFALLASRRAEQLGWYDLAITESIEDIENGSTNSLIEAKINEAINNPRCEVLSLLFSKITSDKDLARLIAHMITLPVIKLVDENVFDDLVALALRIPLDNNNVLSWLMAFGPYSYFPETRQSAVTEISIRVKTKPKKQFHKLSKDFDAAHLADLPLDYKEDVMEKTWENTYRRTRLILGQEPNIISAAKTTLSLPNSIWQAIKK